MEKEQIFRVNPEMGSTPAFYGIGPGPWPDCRPVGPPGPGRNLTFNGEAS